jgi:hypothetical protein
MAMRVKDTQILTVKATGLKNNYVSQKLREAKELKFVCTPPIVVGAL